MEMSLSQRIARFLEIINYFVLVPTSLIEIVALIVCLISLAHGEFDGLSFCVVITAIYSVGTLLLYGYRKHSRGEASKTAAFWLWIGTIGFNSIPFFWMLSIWAINNFTFEDKKAEFWFYNFFGGYLSVILLAVAALISDLRSKFK